MNAIIKPSTVSPIIRLNSLFSYRGFNFIVKPMSTYGWVDNSSTSLKLYIGDNFILTISLNELKDIRNTINRRWNEIMTKWNEVKKYIPNNAKPSTFKGFSSSIDSFGASPSASSDSTPPPVKTQQAIISGPTGQAAATLPVITWKDTINSNVFVYRGRNFRWGQSKIVGIGDSINTVRDLYIGANRLPFTEKIEIAKNPLQTALFIDKNWTAIDIAFRKAVANAASQVATTTSPIVTPTAKPSVSGPTIQTATQSKPPIVPTGGLIIEGVTIQNPTYSSPGKISSGYINNVIYQFNYDSNGYLRIKSSSGQDLYFTDSTGVRKLYPVVNANFSYAVNKGNLGPSALGSITQTAPNTSVTQTQTTQTQGNVPVITWISATQSNLFQYRGYNFQFSKNEINSGNLDLRLGTHIVMTGLTNGYVRGLTGTQVAALIDANWTSIFASWKDSVARLSAVNAASSLAPTAAKTSIANNPLLNSQPQVVAPSASITPKGEVVIVEKNVAVNNLTPSTSTGSNVTTNPANNAFNQTIPVVPMVSVMNNGAYIPPGTINPSTGVYNPGSGGGGAFIDPDTGGYASYTVSGSIGSPVGENASSNAAPALILGALASMLLLGK